MKPTDFLPADFKPGQPPSADVVLAARLAAGLTQTQAAAAAGLGHYRRWGEYETGTRPMDPGRFELFLLRHHLHPTLELRPRR